MRAIQTTPTTAAEDLTGSLYCAVALDDGKVANNGYEASGILQNKAANGDHATLAWHGESKYKSGGSITAGDKLTVTTSGVMITANSGSTVVGKALNSINSGSLGSGIFEFATGNTIAQDVGMAFTAGEAIEASGIAIGSGGLVLEAGTPLIGVSLAAVASAAEGRLAVDGAVQVRVGGGTVNQGVSLVPTGSGYFVAQAGSGDYAVATLLEDTTSGSLGTARLGMHVVN